MTAEASETATAKVYDLPSRLGDGETYFGPQELMATLIRIEATNKDILERMSKVERIIEIIGGEVKPIIDELTNGPVGKILGLKAK